MANDDFSEPPRRADSKHPIFIFFPEVWVRVTSGARGSVSVGAPSIEPFFGGEGSSQWDCIAPPPPQSLTPLSGPDGCAGDLRCLEVALRAGADPNLQDAQGDTPLALATARADPACVSLLLRAGGKADVLNYRNMTGVWLWCWTVP